MKKVVIFLLLSVIALSFISCSDGGNDIAENVTEKIAETIAETVEITVHPKEDETCIRYLPGNICDPNLFSTSEKGVELFVKASANPVKKGENFVLTATATNRTGKTIYIYLPTGTENSHEEIDVVIKDENNRRFVDLDTQGKAFTCDTKMITLENGESIVQVMNMAPGYLIDGSMYPLGEPITYFDAGTYYGEAVFNWHYVNYDVTTGEIDEMQTASLDFSVIIE